MFIYVGDTHGYLSHAERLVSRLERNGYLSDHKLVFLGDYLDRGPDVRGLLQLCIDLQKLGHIFIMGNHEYVLLRTMHEEERRRRWAEFWGLQFGETTLQSFGIKPRDHHFDWLQILELFQSSLSHVESKFLESLSCYHESKDHLAIHSGVLDDPSWKQQKQGLDKWDFRIDPCPPQIDERGLDCLPCDLQKIVVSGHCIVGPDPVFRGNLARIDTGVFRYGRLTAWIPDQKEIAVANAREVTIRRLDG